MMRKKERRGQGTRQEHACSGSDGSKASNGTIGDGNEAILAASAAAALAQVKPSESTATGAGMRVHNGFGSLSTRSKRAAGIEAIPTNPKHSKANS
jgi:hypothetical protein